MSLNYPIRAVAEKTGLSAHTIRAWERRYGVLSPNRTDTNRRMYSESDIARLALLQRAVEAGHSIGLISGLSDPELEHLAGPTQGKASAKGATGGFLAECRTAMLALDAASFEECLGRASSVLGVDGLLADVVIPLIEEVDQGWPAGRVRIAHEHLASALLRTQLEQIRSSLHAKVGAPRLLVTTPKGQLHELGALILAVTAACEGWQVIYMGPNLPAEEIILAARQIGVQAIALSIVYPVADAVLADELRRLHSELGPRTPILVGGRASGKYSEVLSEIGAIDSKDSATMREALATLKGACWSGNR